MVDRHIHMWSKVSKGVQNKMRNELFYNFLHPHQFHYFQELYKHFAYDVERNIHATVNIPIKYILIEEFND